MKVTPIMPDRETESKPQAGLSSKLKTNAFFQLFEQTIDMQLDVGYEDTARTSAEARPGMYQARSFPGDKPRRIGWAAARVRGNRRTTLAAVIYVKFLG